MERKSQPTKTGIHKMTTNAENAAQQPARSLIEQGLDGPSVYVGTNGKYNSGNLKGVWIGLEQFAGDKEGFLDACKSLHADEPDPELMIQDYQCFPSQYYGESGLDNRIWAWLELDEEERELMERYEDATGSAAASIEEARDAFVGKYESGADYAEQLAIDTGAIPRSLPDWLRDAIDWERAWDHSLRFDFSTSEEHHDEIWIFHA